MLFLRGEPCHWDWLLTHSLEDLPCKKPEWKLFFYSELLWWYNLLNNTTESSVAADLYGVEVNETFFPTCPWWSEQQNADSASELVTLLPANSLKDLAISGFLPALQLLLWEDRPACPLHCGVQSAALLSRSLQAPLLGSSYVRTGVSGCPLLLLVNCLSAISGFLQKKKKKGRQPSAGVNLFLIKIYIWHQE